VDSSKIASGPGWELAGQYGKRMAGLRELFFQRWQGGAGFGRPERLAQGRRVGRRRQLKLLVQKIELLFAGRRLFSSVAAIARVVKLLGWAVVTTLAVRLRRAASSWKS